MQRGTPTYIGESTYIQIRANNTRGSEIKYRLYRNIGEGDTSNRTTELTQQTLQLNITITMLAEKTCFIQMEEEEEECSWGGYKYLQDSQEFPELIIWGLLKTDTILKVAYADMVGWNIDMPDNSNCKARSEMLDYLEFLSEDNASLAYRTFILGGNFEILLVLLILFIVKVITLLG